MANKLKSVRELFGRMSADGKTRHILRNFNFGMMGGETLPSVSELAKELGFDLYLKNLPKNLRGRLERDTFAENGYRIEVNAQDDVRTRRWTVLHEIIHFLLHRRDDPFAEALNRAGPLHFYDHHEMREEQEANEFTEALVFGDGALEAAVSLHGRNLETLSRHFGVSVATMKIALGKL